MKTIARLFCLLLVGAATAYVAERMVGHLAAVAIPRETVAQIKSVPGLAELMSAGLMSIVPAALAGAIGGILAYPLLRHRSGWLALVFALGAITYTHGLSLVLSDYADQNFAHQLALLAEPRVLAFYAAPLLAALVAVAVLRHKEPTRTKNAV